MMLTFLWSETGGHSAVILTQLSQQPRGNGEKVTSSQRLDLSGVPEGRTHHHGAVIKLLIVVIDLCYTYHTCTNRSEERDEKLWLLGEELKKKKFTNETLHA